LAARRRARRSGRDPRRARGAGRGRSGAERAGRAPVLRRDDPRRDRALPRDLADHGRAPLAPRPRLAVSPPDERDRMTGPSPDEVARLFERALAAAPGERAAVLDACGDPAVRREVESLLAADAQAGGFLELPQPGADPGDARIGPYRLVRSLGEGEV